MTLRLPWLGGFELLMVDTEKKSSVNKYNSYFWEDHLNDDAHNNSQGLNHSDFQGWLVLILKADHSDITLVPSEQCAQLITACTIPLVVST